MKTEQTIRRWWRRRRERAYFLVSVLALMAAVRLVSLSGCAGPIETEPLAEPTIQTDLADPLSIAAASGSSFGGDPVGPERLNVLDNIAFRVGYSETRGNPAWVTYKVAGPPTTTYSERPDRFTIDERTSARISHDDYTRTGFDRGHMAPNYAIYSRYGSAAQAETFMMSNICPQYAGMNRGIWREIEEMAAMEKKDNPSWASERLEIWVATGPVFDYDRNLTTKGVEIPDAFYKIFIDVDEENNVIDTLAFLVPNESYVSDDPADYLTTIDRIESLTDLDFFGPLEDALENRVESFKARNVWP